MPAQKGITGNSHCEKTTVDRGVAEVESGF